MIFALFIMPMLKVDPNEYNEYMGKAQAKEAISGSEGNDGGSNQQRLQ